MRVLTDSEKSFLAYLRKGGIEFSHSTGFSQVFLDDENAVAAFCADYDSFIAASEGVSKDEYVAFISGEGTPCSAYTKRDGHARGGLSMKDGSVN